MTEPPAVPDVDVDPITLEVIRYGLKAVADQMEAMLVQSAYSTIVKEGLDASAAVFDAAGQNLAQAASIPNHLGCMIPATETALRRWPAPEMRDGDVYILNDPYGGGTHLPDIAIIRPVFVSGTLVALATAMSHHQDVGGSVPGSLPPTATEIYQEGLRIPVMKLIDAGEEVTQVFEIIAANVRTPDVVFGDLRAQLAAVDLAERRITELVSRYGVAGFQAATARLLDQSEQLTRRALERIPDGSYAFTDYLDDDGIVRGTLIPIKATVTISGSEIHIDFTGSAPQVRGPFNCVTASTMAAVYYVVRSVTGADIPDNSGCYRPISATLPERSILNPSLPAPVNSRTATLRRVCDVLLGCLAQALPDQIPAASCGQLLVMNFGGTDPLTGQFYVTSELGVGGTGGRPGMDGVDAVDTDATNCMNVPAEAIEMDSPIRVLSWRIGRDSAGAGRWRGGCGTEKEFQVVRGSASANYRGERHTTAPWGARGGQAAPFSRGWVHRAGGASEELDSKAMVLLGEGDRLFTSICGGGGFGDPALRAPEDVLSDVLDMRVSVAAARERYLVVIDEDAHAVDAAATRALRAGREAK